MEVLLCGIPGVSAERGNDICRNERGETVVSLLLPFRGLSCAAAPVRLCGPRPVPPPCLRPGRQAKGEAGC